MLHSRPYSDLTDLKRMIALTQEAWARYGPYTLLHVGDLLWRMRDETYPDRVRLFEDANYRLVAFAEMEGGGSFEVQIAPELYASRQHAAVYAACRRLASHNDADALGQAIRTWAAQEDAWLGRWLVRQGYHRTGDHALHWFRPLDAGDATPAIPAGWLVRSLRGIEELAARADAHRRAWAPSSTTEAHYGRLMALPWYKPALDIVAEAPDGRFVACCNAWLDTRSGVGQLEPVAVDPSYRGMGLGRAVVEMACAALCERGAREAFVCSWYTNQPASRLYAASGFEVRRREFRYVSGDAS